MAGGDGLTLFGLLAVPLLVRTVSTSVASDHACNRECVVGEAPKTCVYNFTVEWYRTLSKACHNCPWVQSDCSRPHCVSADGNVRTHLAINRQMPGPSIEVCEDDTVVVWVTNMLEDGGTISIHWHGIHQDHTPYMDGAPYVTQCPILTKETFRYEFKAKPAGTHWYHSHSGLQIADGLLGAFIVRTPKDTDPNGILYEVDDSGHIMVLNDWLPVTSITRYMDLMHHVFDITAPISGLVNGRARKFNVTDKFNVTLPPTQTPLEVFNVESSMAYRFRLIGATGSCPMKFAIDDHTLIFIATDGIAIEPITVETLIINSGERYDFVLLANQAVDNYVIRVWGLGECLTKNNVYAILHYNGSSDTYPYIDESVRSDGVRLLNPIIVSNDKEIYTSGNLNVYVDDLRSIRYNKVENYTEELADETYFIASDYNNNDNRKFNHPEYYPVEDLPPVKAHFTPVLNNITFDIPPIPPLSQPGDIREEWFCNRSSVSMDTCYDNLCICTHMVSFKLNRIMDIVVVNEGKTFSEVGHPMHLHGHSFRVLGIQTLGEAIQVDDVIELNRQGKLKRNLINPPWKDTVNVPDGGYVVLRLITNNPGYWFFHCHVDSHLAQGMAMLIKIGEPSEFPPVPDVFPKCGGYGYSNARKPPKPPVTPPCKPTSSAAHIRTQPARTYTYILIINCLFYQLS